jgi:hypothetical protein
MVALNCRRTLAEVSWRSHCTSCMECREEHLEQVHLHGQEVVGYISYKKPGVSCPSVAVQIDSLMSLSGAETVEMAQQKGVCCLLQSRACPSWSPSTSNHRWTCPAFLDLRWLWIDRVFCHSTRSSSDEPFWVHLRPTLNGHQPM